MVGNIAFSQYFCPKPRARIRYKTYSLLVSCLQGMPTNYTRVSKLLYIIHVYSLFAVYTVRAHRTRTTPSSLAPRTHILENRNSPPPTPYGHFFSVYISRSNPYQRFFELSVTCSCSRLLYLSPFLRSPTTPSCFSFSHA